ncbi:unnamed protein product, partial [Rotaria sp. Silwood2]
PWEELGLNYYDIYNKIIICDPIIKKVLNVVDNSIIEHYYFIVPVESKDMKFKINKREVDDVEWRSIHDLLCDKNCPGVHRIKSVNVSKESNYFMIICRDSDTRTSLFKNYIYISYGMSLRDLLTINDLNEKSYDCVWQLVGKQIEEKSSSEQQEYEDKLGCGSVYPWDGVGYNLVSI